jgi:hypothetical protein
MPIKNIDVVTYSPQPAGKNQPFKNVYWYYP